MKLAIDKRKLASIILFLIIGLILFGLRFPSFVEPIYYLDEGIYSAISHVMRSGGILYKDVWDNKPPSIYFLYTLSRFFWGYSMLPLKILISILTAFSTFFLFRLTKNWFPKIWITPFLVSLFFVLLTAFEGNVVNAEIIFISLSLGAILLLHRFEEEERVERFILAGFLFGIGISFKSTATFDLIAFLLTYVFFAFLKVTKSRRKDECLQFVVRIAFFLAAAAVPMFLYTCYFFIVGAQSDFFNAVFFTNKDYVSYFNNSIGPFTTLTLNAFLAFFGISVTFGSFLYYRNKKYALSKPYTFILIWIICSTYAAFISGRPYPHYLLQIAPSLAFLIGVTIVQIQFLALIFEFFAFAVLLLYFNRNAQISLYKNLLKDQITYYETSYAFFLGHVSKDTYYQIFKLNSDGLTAMDLQDLIHLSNTYKGSPDDKVFVWGSIPWVSAASELTPTCKYLDNFDINDYQPQQQYTIQCLLETKPRLIIHEDSNYLFPALVKLENTQYHEVKSFYGNQVRFYILN